MFHCCGHTRKEDFTELTFIHLSVESLLIPLCRDSITGSILSHDPIIYSFNQTCKRCQAPLTCLCLLSQQHIHSIICKIPKLSKFKESLLGIRSISDSTKISWTIFIFTVYFRWNINGSGQNKIFVSHPGELELDFWNVIFCSWSFLEKYHTKFLDLTSYLGHTSASINHALIIGKLMFVGN